MKNESKMIIEFKDGGAKLSGNMNIELLNSFVFTVADSYGHDKFIDALNSVVEFEDAKYEATATIDNGDTVIEFEPPLDKDHYLAVCNVVIQAQGDDEE